MRQPVLLLAVYMIFLSTLAPLYAETPPPERDYSQTAINELMTYIETTYAIAFAYPEEWIAGTAGEVIQFTDYLHNILEALEVAAFYLHHYGDPRPRQKPAAYFRALFAPANIRLDRASQIAGGFAGNTLPQRDGGRVQGYLIQLAPSGMNGIFTLVHELGHVVDGLLEDQPQRDFVQALGGQWTSTAWIPGLGYQGNEAFFPRAVAGPNEDFADTFANMFTGRLSTEFAPERYLFMREYAPRWLVQILAQNAP
jgi:hypothetical protein